MGAMPVCQATVLHSGRFAASETACRAGAKWPMALRPYEGSALLGSVLQADMLPFLTVLKFTHEDL